MKTKIQEAIALVKQTNNLLNDVASILSAVEKTKTKPDGTLDNKRIKVTPETKDEIEAIIISHGYKICNKYFQEFPYFVFANGLALYAHKSLYSDNTEIYLHNGQLVDEIPSEEHKEVCRWKNRHDEFNKVYTLSYCPYCGTKLEA